MLLLLAFVYWRHRRRSNAKILAKEVALQEASVERRKLQAEVDELRQKLTEDQQRMVLAQMDAEQVKQLEGYQVCNRLEGNS